MKWKKCKRGGEKVINCMYTATPNDTERYYLRNILLCISGAKSFIDLLKDGDRKCYSFQEACQRLGLLEDDSQWHNTWAEVATFQMPYQLRRMLAMILTHGIVILHIHCNCGSIIWIIQLKVIRE